jgi:aryl-alcohol dehydrogenase-like predicted oxidoreductase
MGKVVSVPSKRQKVFLMTKVAARGAAGAQKQLEDSLRRLRTDVIDLWQFHHLDYFHEIETIFGPGGAMEVAQKARKEGKVRYLGFTGYPPGTGKAAILRTIAPNSLRLRCPSANSSQ